MQQNSVTKQTEICILYVFKLYERDTLILLYIYQHIV